MPMNRIARITAIAIRVAAAFLVAACASVFALGETLLQPTMPAIVNDLAPDHLRGRYNGLSAGTFQAASILGPIVAGFLIGHGLHLEYLLLLIAGCVLVVWLSVARLEPQLSPEDRRRQSDRESAAIIAFTSAIGAYGGFFIPKAYGSSIALTGSALGALWAFLGFYVLCLAVTWVFYTRPGGLLHDIERGRAPSGAATPA